MSKQKMSTGMICSMIVMIAIFIPATILGFTNLHGDLNNTLIHGEKDRFRFFVFGDTKHEAGNLARLNQIFDAAKERRPLFMVLVGDFVVTGTERKYRFFLDKVEDAGVFKAGVPLFLVLGNHELDKKDNSKRLFRKYIGPTHYWFSYGNSLFVCVDTGDGKLDEAELRWMESILKEKRKKYLHTFFFMHYPPTTFAFKKSKKLHHGDKAFMELMERYGVDEVFCGHYHSYGRQVVNGVNYLVTGGGGAKLHDDESFFHYVEVMVNGPVITEKVVALDSSHDYSDMIAYNFKIHAFPWLRSNYPYILLSLFVLSMFVSMVLFQRRKSREPR